VFGPVSVAQSSVGIGQSQCSSLEVAKIDDTAEEEG
jgi:hypothetical protein